MFLSYYENRADLLDIENPEINDRLIEALEQSELDVNQQAKLEQELAKDIHVLTSKKRLDTIAKDFVEHYSELWTTGKAMFVCINKVTAVRMYHLVQDYWIEKDKRNRVYTYWDTQTGVFGDSP
jgi:type I restriction enzyme R subunit